MENVVRWVHAFRLRTLPLAFAGTIVGSFLAIKQSVFKWDIFALSLLATLSLQILSNLANDYGDFSKGTDNENRIGPARTLQSGVISTLEMKRMIIFFIFLSLFFGIWLVYSAFAYISPFLAMCFIGMGVAAIVAAITYTVGKRAYGFKGLGDLFVFIFFGPVSVVGVSILHGVEFSGLWLLPSLTMGLLSVAVLNINNLRDIENDRECGKVTLPVKFGFAWGKRYHVVVTGVAVVALILFTFLTRQSFLEFMWIFICPFVFSQIMDVYSLPSAKLDPYLKKMALSSFGISLLLLFSVLF